MRDEKGHPGRGGPSRASGTRSYSAAIDTGGAFWASLKSTGYVAPGTRTTVGSHPLPSSNCAASATMTSFLLAAMRPATLAPALSRTASKISTFDPALIALLGRHPAPPLSPPRRQCTHFPPARSRCGCRRWPSVPRTRPASLAAPPCHYPAAIPHNAPCSCGRRVRHASSAAVMACRAGLSATPGQAEARAGG
jgi:hypothetical protein